MLSNAHFYHRITRKLVVSFGTIFNNLKLYRYNKEGTEEIERVNVPISYSSKEKYYLRTTQDPELTREVMMTLPRMGFELTAITYDPLRKISSFNKLYAQDSSTSAKAIPSAPYNFDFTLSVYVRNTEDGTQIIEQILPYFSPDYTITVDLIDDVPIILNSVSYEMADTGAADDIRTIIWTLSFTAKAYLYGEIPATGAGKIIRTVYANTYTYVNSPNEPRTLYLASGNGTYRLGEMVYAGASPSSANAKAFVKSWNSTANVITVEDGGGFFTPGERLRGAITGATYTINRYAANTYQQVELIVTPNPLTANLGDDFGFTEVIKEAPHII